MDEKEIDRFEKVETQLVGFLDEFQSLTKKSPSDGVNKFKLKHLNTVLQEANDLLLPKDRPFADFEQFDVDDVPMNSDVVMILRQYCNCLEEVRSRCIAIGYDDGWYWQVDGKAKGTSRRHARPPAKLK